MTGILKPCHTRAASSQRFHSVQKAADRRDAVVQSPATLWKRSENAVKTLCNRLERHAAAFLLNMLKTNAAACRLHSGSDVSASRARCKNAL